MDGVERIEQHTDTMTRWFAKIGGVTKEFEVEITEQIPGERGAWTTLSGEVKQAGVVAFHRLDENRTKVMLQLDYDPDGFAENVGDKLGFVKRQITGDLKRFKEYIENRGRESGSWRGGSEFEPCRVHARRSGSMWASSARLPKSRRKT
ncbi:SRPBCC family protein [Streptomyces sp. adm13(2018)]|nr:SRPBCC family protein [Streptomyces sp. adm13(2018)]